MKDGFIRVAAGSIGVTVASPAANAQTICRRIDEADAAGVNLLVLPELSLCGYTCGDLLFSDALLAACDEALATVIAHTAQRYPVVVMGTPLLHGGKLYNCAAVIYNGALLGMVPKTHLHNHGESDEARHFAAGTTVPAGSTHRIGGQDVPFGTDIVFAHAQMPSFICGVELCEDVWVSTPPSAGLCQNGATVIANPSACAAVIGKADYRRRQIEDVSARQLCAYVCADAGPEESTQDIVCSAHHLIAEGGRLLAEHPPFSEDTLTITEVDSGRLAHERRRHSTFTPAATVRCVMFSQPMRDIALTRAVSPTPFVPAHPAARTARAEEVLAIQSHGLAKRLAHTRAACAVIGVSGGLDSTLALLVAARAMDILARPRTDIVAVTMPCFGTTARTRSNAEILCEQLGTAFRTVDITAAVTQHFTDIGHPLDRLDVTYENAQARERTQVLMDIANQQNGMVIGTGDLSELALGWATYNGDHMSMYGVNAGVPKTLVRHLVAHEASRADEAFKTVLTDILDTPVSPELLPPDAAGDIAQKTEDLVGPYALHDFFLYYTVRHGMRPRKIERLARIAFAGEYTDAVIRKWLRVFVRRFFNQQFKRSCLPDGPKVGSVSLSPRGDWRMPSDAVSDAWI